MLLSELHNHSQLPHVPDCPHATVPESPTNSGGLVGGIQSHNASPEHSSVTSVQIRSPLPFNCPLQSQVPPHGVDDELFEELELPELLEPLDEVELELVEDDDELGEPEELEGLLLLLELEPDELVDDELLPLELGDELELALDDVELDELLLDDDELDELELDEDELLELDDDDGPPVTGIRHGLHSQLSAVMPNKRCNERFTPAIGLGHNAENPGSDLKIGIDI